MASSKPTKFAQFLVFSVRKSMVKKYLISNRFDFLDRFFASFFIIPYDIYIYFVQKGVCNLRIIYLLQSLFFIIKIQA